MSNVANSAPSPKRSVTPLIIVLCVVVIVVAVIAYRVSKPPLPSPGTDKYRQMVSAFYSGAIALAAGDSTDALAPLQKSTKIVPGEPSGWADLGLYYLEPDTQNLTLAEQYLDKAHSLAPESSDVEALLGSLEQLKGNYDKSADYLTKAVAIDPADIKARYRLSQVIAQQSAPDSVTKQEEQLQAILATQPNNLVALLDLSHLSGVAKQGDLLKSVIDKIAAQSGSWPSTSEDSTSNPRTQLAAVQKVAASPDLSSAGVQTQILYNELDSSPPFQQGLRMLGANSVGTNSTPSVGAPVTHFILMPSPPSTPAPPDLGLAFASQPIPGAGKDSVARPIWVNLDTPSAVATVGASGLTVLPSSGSPIQLAFPGKAAGPGCVLPIDWNDDTHVDLALTGSAGVKLYQQNANGPVAFSDVTSRSKLPDNIVNGSYTGAWTASLETGGELDIVLGAKSGAPAALRNNSDGTFTAIHPFPGETSGIQGFAWADLDNDGLSDAAMVDGQGRLLVYHNQASGIFAPWAIPAGFDHVAAICGADLNRTGSFGLIVLGQDGSLQYLGLKGDSALDLKDGSAWTVSTLGHVAAPPTDGTARLLAADLDDNGSVDLVVTSSAGTQALLSDAQGKLALLSTPMDVREASIEDDGQSGHLNLVGLSSAGAVVRLTSHGTKNYGWQEIRLAALKLADGERNNSFGIGSQIALRAGLLYENQTVAGPATHFGLGTYATADAARIVWPNGNPQAEFGLTPKALYKATERPKGSCPWLFAWNGHKMAFVTDFLWRSALGLRIGAQNTVGVPMTSDWNRIGGDQLAPINGSYDFRLTTQLWETYYFDQIKLMVVDHPVGTQMWVDERFCIPPPKLAYHIMGKPQTIVRATDNAGRDVTDLLSARDGRYVDSFARDRFQGVAKPHYVQVDLGKAPELAGKQWLIANGWIHPTDSSINLALSFGNNPHPHGVVLSIPDGHGGWKVVRPDLGFPEGINKTILIDLTGLFKPGQERLVRIATNMEIYWDWMATAMEPPLTKSKAQTLSLSTANLRYHGFNAIQHASLSAPMLPDYDKVAAVGQQWRDMTGYYTRYGDVKPLLASIDDRYVIMNAGDEIDLRFKAIPPPPAGWTRDYILTGDGWGKDCDINTGYGQTVLPLPSHADNLYTRAPTTLQNEPVYKAHKADWQNYQTRYVSPSAFDNAFLPNP